MLIIAEGDARPEVEGKAMPLGLFNGAVLAFVRDLKGHGLVPTEDALPPPEAVMIALPDVRRRALLRKDTPQVQGVPISYANPEGEDAPARAAAWLESTA